MIKKDWKKTEKISRRKERSEKNLLEVLKRNVIIVAKNLTQKPQKKLA